MVDLYGYYVTPNPMECVQAVQPPHPLILAEHQNIYLVRIPCAFLAFSSIMINQNVVHGITIKQSPNLAAMTTQVYYYRVTADR